MKPANRSLEIVAVGLGQAGGNLAAEFFRRNYRALALNTAHTDLASLAPGGTHLNLPSEQRIYIGIDGYDGAGADLNYGRECLSQHEEQIRSAVSAHAAGADVVVLAAGLGGGTGSALRELVEVLKDLSLPLVALTTLPHEHESGIAKVNAVRAVNDLVKAPLQGWILVDNQLLSQVHGEVSLDQYYAKINGVIIDPLDVFNCLNDREKVKAIRPLDGEDFRTILLSGGLVNYGSGHMSKITVDSVMQSMRECMQYSTLMPSGGALDRVSYLGLVLEANEETLRETPFSFFEQINDQLKDETGGAAVYLGVYRSSEEKTVQVTWRLLACSQSLPDGIQEMVTNAKREGGALAAKLQQELPSLELGDIESLDLFRTHTLTGTLESPARRRVQQKLDLSVEAPAMVKTPSLPPSSTFSAASIPSAPEPPGQPKTVTRPPLPPSGNGDTDAESVDASFSGSGPPARSSQISGVRSKDDDESAKESAASAVSGKLPSDADRETFDRLIQDYQNAKSDEKRKPIIEKLQKESGAESPLVRYYAVRAMTKLDPEVFADALQTAIDDEDATVRSIAKKALRKQASAAGD